MTIRKFQIIAVCSFALSFFSGFIAVKLYQPASIGLFIKVAAK